MIKFLLLACTLSAASLVASPDEQTEPAVAAAKAWLEMVDTKEYPKSWQEAAPFFKEKITEKQWVEMVSAVRDPLGKMKSREMLRTQFTKTLPGAPDGKYVVIQFKTNFAAKPDAIETITPMKSNGAWRVSGYFIK